MDLPTEIGRYRILGLLDTGGMAEVFLGKLEGPGGFERPVVIKRVLPHLARQTEFREMFLDEARVIAELTHPNIVSVVELGETERGELFLVMEYLAGESLSGVARRLRMRRERLPPELAAFVMAEACAGMHAAHEHEDADGNPRGIVHRDISPQNLFVTYEGNVQVLDFGIALATNRHAKTDSGVLKGKFPYMSPEQIHREDLDRRSDLFALGVVLHEISTGHRLFSRPSELDILRAITEEPIPTPTERAPEYPAELERICMKALARDREDRYQSAAEMRRDLVRFASTVPSDELPQERLSTTMRRIFEDRMSEKKEMLRRLRAGGALTYIPKVDADPSEPDEVSISVTTTDPRETVARPGPPSRRGFFAVALAVIVAAAGVSLWATQGEPESGGAAVSIPPDRANPSDLRAGATRETAPEPQPTAEQEHAEEVTVSVETTPPGARVVVGGEARGTAPVVLTLSRGTEPVTIEAALRGHRGDRIQIIPDRDIELALDLERVPATRRGTRMQTMMTPSADFDMAAFPD